jgi:hypothetical protein
VTQIFLTRSRRSRVAIGANPASQVLRLAQDIQVTVVAERKK